MLRKFYKGGVGCVSGEFVLYLFCFSFRIKGDEGERVPPTFGEEVFNSCDCVSVFVVLAVGLRWKCWFVFVGWCALFRYDDVDSLRSLWIRLHQMSVPIEDRGHR